MRQFVTSYASTALLLVITITCTLIINTYFLDPNNLSRSNLLRHGHMYEPHNLVVTDKTSTSHNVECTFVIICGTGDKDTIKEMQPLLVSAILLASCRLKFILITEEESANNALILFNEKIKTTMKPVTIEIYILSPAYIIEWADQMKYNIYSHHSTVWGTAKLLVPWILPAEKYNQVIVIDSDMVFLQDPRLLFSHFDNSSFAYKMPLNGNNPSTICSCVVLMNINVILKNKFYPDKFKYVLSHSSEELVDNTTGFVSPIHGDQGFYFLLSQQYPHLFESLPNRFNMDHCNNYHQGLDNNSDRNLSLIHYNCDFLTKPAERRAGLIFDFYKQYSLLWLRGFGQSNYPIQTSIFKYPSS